MYDKAQKKARVEFLRKYVRLMRTHDFSYQYSDDINLWNRENNKRIKILALRMTLISRPWGRRVVTLAERRYGHVR